MREFALAYKKGGAKEIEKVLRKMSVPRKAPTKGAK
jgi:hypothetical protein